MYHSNYYGILPGVVRFNPNITSFQKVIYSELAAMADTNAEASFENKDVAAEFHVTVSKVTKALQVLEEEGHIAITRKGRQRVIKLLDL